MGKKNYRLGDLQLQIMKVLWTGGAVTVSDVHKALARRSGLAPTTVATMLRKMEDRGLVKHQVEGRKFLYQAAVTEDVVSRTMADHVLEGVFEGSLADMVSHLLRRRDVTAQDLDELERLIAERKARG